MRRQTGNELDINDWLGVARGINAVSGAMNRSETQGFKREDREEDKRLKSATNTGVEVIGKGMSLDNTRSYLKGDSVPATQDIVDQINEPGADITMRTNKFTPATGEKGFQNALQLDIDSQNKLTHKMSDDYLNQIYKMNPREVDAFDVSQAENPRAAMLAKNRYFIEKGKTSDSQAKEMERVNAVKNNMYQEWSGGIRTAENLLKDKQGVKASNIMADLVNNKNNTAYKAKVLPDGKIQTYITYDGEDKVGDIYSPSDFLKEIKNVTKEKYFQAFDADYRMSRDMNEKSAWQPKWMTNGKDFVQVQTFRKPLSSEHEFMVFDKNGGMYPVQDLNELRKNKFYDYKPLDSKQQAKAATTKSKNFDAAVKRIKGMAELIAEKDPRFTTNEMGDILDAKTGQKAGIAPYAMAIQNLVAAGKMTQQEAAEAALAMGISATGDVQPKDPVDERKEGIFNSLLGIVGDNLSEKNQPRIAPEPPATERSKFDRSLDKYAPPMSKEEEARLREEYEKAQAAKYPAGLVKLVNPNENRNFAMKTR